MFPFAPQPDVYRSAQKDDAVLHKLRDDFSELALQLGGQRWAHRQAELDMLASAAYYGLTQLIGGTTLGEEYCDLLMVAEHRRRRRDTREHVSTPPPLEEEKQPSLEPSSTSSAAHTSPNLLTSSPTSASSPLLGNPALPVSSAASLPTASPAFPLALTAPLSTSLLPAPSLSTSFSPLSTSDWELPSGRRRVCLFVLQVVVPYLYVRAKKQQQTLSPPLANQHSTAATLYYRLLSVLPTVEAVLPHVHRLQLVLFFLSARFVSLSHRAAGVRFVHLRQDVANSRPSYTGLGVLLLIQLAATAVVKSWQAVDGWRERRRRREEDAATGSGQRLTQPRNSIQQRMADEKTDEADDDSSTDERIDARQCILHLGPVRNATATECGHVYCWNCIAECCKQKPECPLCRTPIALDNLLLLVNYT